MQCGLPHGGMCAFPWFSALSPTRFELAEKLGNIRSPDNERRYRCRIWSRVQLISRLRLRSCNFRVDPEDQSFAATPLNKRVAVWARASFRARARRREDRPLPRCSETPKPPRKPAAAAKRRTVHPRRESRSKLLVGNELAVPSGNPCSASGLNDACIRQRCRQISGTRKAPRVPGGLYLIRDQRRIVPCRQLARRFTKSRRSEISRFTWNGLDNDRAQ